MLLGGVGGGGGGEGEAGIKGGSGREKDRTEHLQRTQPALPRSSQKPGHCSSNRQGLCSSHPHFTDEETEAQKAKLTYSLRD